MCDTAIQSVYTILCTYTILYILFIVEVELYLVLFILDSGIMAYIGPLEPVDHALYMKDKVVLQIAKENIGCGDLVITER